VLGSEAVTNILHALATGFLDRAVNVVAMSDEINEDERAILLARTDRRPESLRASAAVRRRPCGHWVPSGNSSMSAIASRFTPVTEWKALSANPLYAFFTANRSGYPWTNGSITSRSTTGT